MEKYYCKNMEIFRKSINYWRIIKANEILAFFNQHRELRSIGRKMIKFSNNFLKTETDKNFVEKRFSTFSHPLLQKRPTTYLW